MLFFNSFPKILTTDYKGNGIIMTNIMVRTRILSTLSQNPLIFYTYGIQDGDRPDIIATKYYGDQDRFWMIFYGNQLYDPLWDWPLKTNEFLSYLQDKYGSDAANNNTSVLTYTQNTVYQYTKTIITLDNTSNKQTVKTIIIDQNTYNTATQGVTTSSFTNGTTVTQTILINAQSIYDYENQQNESKRNINLINKSYASQLERDFASLMKK